MKLIPVVIISLCLPSLAQAQAYKCRQPNGSLAFQDHPCQNGATGARVNLSPVQGYAAVPLSPAASGANATPAASGNLRADQLQRLNAANADLQATAAKMRADNPNWQKSQSLSRLNAEAEAINDRVQSDNNQAR
jgi:hypothetical protein